MFEQTLRHSLDYYVEISYPIHADPSGRFGFLKFAHSFLGTVLLL